MAIVGRPNVGKSTLINALVGEKVAITSSRPETTRRVVRGIVNREDAQLVLVDTPGLHRPRTLLGERLNDRVREALVDVDVVGVCLPANEAIGPGDRFLIAALPRTKRIAIITKRDTVKRDELVAKLAEVAALFDGDGTGKSDGTGDREDSGKSDGTGDWDDVVPVSGITGEGVPELEAVAICHLPEGPRWYEADATSDETTEGMIAELVREAMLEGVREELPHSIAVAVEEIDRTEEPPIVRVNVYVERDSQKGIVIGKGASRLKNVKRVARKGIERLLGERVQLDIHVKVAKDWQRDPKALRRLGF
jgi:GTP-binding protein Era